MLKSLSIQNIVLIEKANLAFGSGLCILSGETGSGKSLLLDALGLAIGFRSNLRLIGNDENKAQVSAEFDISANFLCQKILEEHDLIDHQNASSVVIRRSIQENSASKVFVNDNPIGVNLLAKIGESLIEIHGQHDQGSLLTPSLHLDILDEFAGNQNLLQKIQKIYEELKEVSEKIALIKAKKEQILREKDYLEYSIKELFDADLTSGEEENLVNQKSQLNAKEKINNFASDLKKQLLEANSQLILAQRNLMRGSNLIDNYLVEEKEFFADLSNKIDQQNIDLDCAIDAIESFLRKINSEDKNLAEIEERLFFIRSLARKFDVKSDDLPQLITIFQQKLATICAEEEGGFDLERRKEILISEYKNIASELSKIRMESSLKLAQKVEEELQFLKMGAVKFKVAISKNELAEFSVKGDDKARFQAAINNNQFDDISKIASGGELSRFMLALKVALIDVKSVPTMIFDEIDSGIGGSTSDAVGKRLKILSEKLQVFVVTHQPQIAAKADDHFKISKIFEGEKIRTKILQLDEESRLEEIARMISGEEISAEALAAAKNLVIQG